MACGVSTSCLIGVISVYWPDNVGHADMPLRAAFQTSCRSAAVQRKLISTLGAPIALRVLGPSSFIRWDLPMAIAIHRCMACNAVQRVRYRLEMRPIGYGRKEPVYFRESDGRRNVQPVMCCGRQTKWGYLKATYNAAVKCDARCTEAKGFKCECSCAGEHHGSGAGMFTSLLEAAR